MATPVEISAAGTKNVPTVFYFAPEI